MGDRISFINSEINRTQAYHNHKENMAWLATVLYITGAFALGAKFSELAEVYERTLALILAVAITGLAFYFVCWQFKNRKIAAERVKKLVGIAEHLIEGDNEANNELAQYFGCIREYKIDPEKTQVISLIAMGIAFVVFLVLICC